MRHFLLVLLALTLVGCANGVDQGAPSPGADAGEETSLPQPAEAADDLTALESPHVETLLRNEYVDVHRVTLPADASLAAHQGGARVVYSLGDYTLDFTADGGSETQSFTAGDVHEHGPGVHAVDNVGGTEASFLIFERRDAELPSSEAESETPMPSAGAGATQEVLFEGEVAQVHRVALEPGAQLPSHQGHARAVYSLNDYALEYTDDAGTREQRFEAGDVHYHDPGEHAVENVGESTAEFLVVELIR